MFSFHATRAGVRSVPQEAWSRRSGNGSPCYGCNEQLLPSEMPTSNDFYRLALLFHKQLSASASTPAAEGMQANTRAAAPTRPQPETRGWGGGGEEGTASGHNRLQGARPAPPWRVPPPPQGAGRGGAGAGPAWAGLERREGGASGAARRGGASREAPDERGARAVTPGAGPTNARARRWFLNAGERR